MDLLPYLKMMVEKNGSDLFFSVGARPNIKVEGKTIPIGSEPVDAETTKRLAYSIMSQNEIKAFESDLELNIVAMALAGSGLISISLVMRYRW
jgi:twitching motility protein PilU